MANQWESRERRVRKMALIASVVLHLAAILLISTGFGDGAVQDLIQNVFGSDPVTQVEESKV